MLNRTMIKLAALAAAGVATPALAQNNTASATTNGSTTIVAPITITENSSLRFGSLVRPTAGTSTVTLSTATCATALSGAGNAALITSTSGCATYQAGGETGLAFNITTPATFNLTRSGGTETIAVALNKSATTGTIGAATDQFKVGGNFDVTNATVAGAYSGTFSVTVTYQ